MKTFENFNEEQLFTLGRKTVFQTFLAIMVEADSMEESVEDMTAALMAPRPKKATQVGVKYCKVSGNTIAVSVAPLYLPGTCSPGQSCL